MPVARDDVRVGAFLEDLSDGLLPARFVMRVQPVDIFDPGHTAQCGGVHGGISHYRSVCSGAGMRFDSLELADPLDAMASAL